MTGDADRMEENSFGQKLLAEVLGTGFLVFIGVGSVPATLLLNGNGTAHPFTMADLGIISFAFALIVLKTAVGQATFEAVGGVITRVLNFSVEGSKFVFGLRRVSLLRALLRGVPTRERSLTPVLGT